MNDFAEIFKNLYLKAGYRSENNFVGLSKLIMKKNCFAPHIII